MRRFENIRHNEIQPPSRANLLNLRDFRKARRWRMSPGRLNRNAQKNAYQSMRDPDRPISETSFCPRNGKQPVSLSLRAPSDRCDQWPFLDSSAVVASCGSCVWGKLRSWGNICHLRVVAATECLLVEGNKRREIRGSGSRQTRASILALQRQTAQRDQSRTRSR